MKPAMPVDLSKKLPIDEKIAALNEIPGVVSSYLKIRSGVSKISKEEENVLKQLIALGQFNQSSVDEEKLKALLEKLIRVDVFYQELGGLIGYQQKVLDLVNEQDEREAEASSKTATFFHSPCFTDISEETELLWEALHEGIKALPIMAEMVPLGGAADRLHLLDEKTGQELPAAKLSFAGRPLLSTIFRDLQAREHLYYKIYGKQTLTPIALMTSEDKDNHRHVERLLKENNWFGRPKESIRLFMQPLVPVVSETGQWRWTAPYTLLMKPGGHGVIWKLARDQGIFDWFKQLGRKKALIRQINNPIAGLDYGLLAFTGVGVKNKMLFGFASCPRLLQAAEGVNVLLEKKNSIKSQIVLTNVEYCDFSRFGIQDSPLKKGEPYSRFSSNTNILFADLGALSRAIDRCPYPGLLINLKKMAYTTASGEKKEEMLARLESTMQNIADVFAEKKGEVLATKRTFITYNQRLKTISTAKKAYSPSSPLQETPENCFYDLLRANRELLEKRCGFQTCKTRTIQEYLEKGPESIFLYHPALGPLYSIIAQKLRSGYLHLGAELQLEIADLDCQDLDLDGSLLVHAEQIMGHFDPFLRYSDKTGRCILRNVKVSNQGVDWTRSSPFWKNRFVRKEAVEIILKGHSEFVAEDLVLIGHHRFEVEDGVSLRVFQENGKLTVHKQEISDDPLWGFLKTKQIELVKGNVPAHLETV